MSEIVIGLTIVAFGTSAPELFVNLLSAIQGSTDIALGNILGSNIANILLILGIGALVHPIVVKRVTVLKEIPFALLTAVVLGAVAIDQWMSPGNNLSFNDGIILLGFFAVYMYSLIGSVKKESPVSETPSESSVSSMKAIVWIMVGLTGLVVGGKWIVDGAVAIAQLFSLSERIIGLTIIAIGTSLPELATTIVAARKGKGDLVIGNVIGSNIFNTLWILGLTSVLHPIAVAPENTLSFIVNIGATLLILVILGINYKNHLIKRWHGILLLVIYVATIILSLD
jgi:cation:H+ antiporter